MDFDPAQLEALAFSLSEGSFDAAARALHVTPSAISQRIKALETAVGQILVTRTRPVQPTRAGEAVLRLATQIRAITAEVARELGGTSGQDVNVTVPLAVNADSLATWVLPALAGVDAAVVFDIQREDQDRTAELLRRGTVMAAITASADPVPGCSVDRLGSMHYRPMAAPEFAQRWLPDGPTPAALAVAPVVVFDRNDRLQDRYLRRRSHRQARPPRHYIPGSADFLEAVRLGRVSQVLGGRQASLGE